MLDEMEMRTKLWFDRVEESDRLQDKGVEGRTVLKYVFRK
jgi:hypothetical protein